MKNVNESGRSMVEMLGVLAIIGVLSVGGIAGYTRAMRNWKANEIIEAANRLAVVAETDQTLTSTAGSNTLTYSGIGGDTSRLPGLSEITATKNTNGTISLTISLSDSTLQTPIEEKLTSCSSHVCTLGAGGTSFSTTVSTSD